MTYIATKTKRNTLKITYYNKSGSTVEAVEEKFILKVNVIQFEESHRMCYIDN